MNGNAVLEAVTVTCPDCRGEGAIETPIPGGVWNRQLGGWEPDNYVSDCERCKRKGILTVEVDELDWLDPDVDAPPVGELVVVRGKQDGAPDSVVGVYTDRLVSPGVWDSSAVVYEWASLEDYQ